MNGLSDRLGVELFARLFPIILTDRGSEFSDPESIERRRRTNHDESLLLHPKLAVGEAFLRKKPFGGKKDIQEGDGH